MPFSVSDARDLLISSVLCKDPVIFIDDRWLYDQEEEVSPIEEKNIDQFQPICIKDGGDLTIVGSSYSTKLALETQGFLAKHGINAEVIDTRVINPFNFKKILSR